ncbi:MAG: glycosyltransferase family 2 protein [Cyclobacteriaceae bacterium]
MPTATVICTCYNHEKFVVEAILSVLDQSYENIQLIVIDDASTDNSVIAIEGIITDKDFRFIKNKKNQGLCKNFNNALKYAQGKYVIDLSADDVLFNNRIETQVEFFELLSEDYGVVFSNAELINEDDGFQKHFYKIGRDKLALEKPNVGNVYTDLIGKFFIAAPTMMMRKSMLDELGGYDETLAYEDFDFWIRSSRNWKYAFQDKVLTKIRETSGSLSSTQYLAGDEQLATTYEVCRKIYDLNESKAENEALIGRLKYEIKHAVMAEKRDDAQNFLTLLKKLEPTSKTAKFFDQLNRLNLPTSWLRNSLQKIRT